MGIFDKFKKKKDQLAAPQQPALAAAPAPVKEQKVKGPAVGQLSQILLRPIVSEKGARLAGSGRYVFEVTPEANKTEIKKSVERVFNVHVEHVGIINLPAKSRRWGRVVGKTAHWKKAIVKLRTGEKIPGIIESVG